MKISRNLILRDCKQKRYMENVDYYEKMSKRMNMDVLKCY